MKRLGHKLVLQCVALRQAEPADLRFVAERQQRVRLMVDHGQI